MLRRLPPPRFSWRLYIADDGLRSHSYVRLLHEVVTFETLEPSSSSNSDITVSYLTNTCGLSPVAALSAANKLRLKATGNADSVLDFLRTHGFTGSEISKLVTKNPRILSMKFEKIMKPKFEFFLSAGLSTAILRKVVTASPHILDTSLARIKPNFELLKTILGGANEAAQAIRATSSILQGNEVANGYLRNMLINMKKLEEYGVPRHRLIKLAAVYARAFIQCPTKFSKEAAFLKETGFDPLKSTFMSGIVVTCGLSHSMRERKLQLYRSLGWPEGDIDLLFKNFPMCLLFSEERIKQATSFFVEKLKWKHSFLAARPKFLSHSLDKTIIPRNNIFDILESNGLVKSTSRPRCLQITEKQFLDLYVIRYEKQFPEVLEAYKIKLDLLAKVKNVY